MRGCSGQAGGVSRWGRLVLLLIIAWAASGRALAHPGNVIATLEPRMQGGEAQLEAVLTFDGTGEPLLGAQLTWSDRGKADWHPFALAGGPNVHLATLPIPNGTSHFNLHILSLGETTEAEFSLSARGDHLRVEPREVLLLFPDVGLPEYQLVLIVVVVMVGMMVIIVRKPGGGPDT